jgi:ribonucleotide reductase beta subunit family protein with ferritin-like domain
MSRSVFNKSKDVSFLKQPMFFGEDLAVQRYDTMKYPIFDKLTQQQLGYFWRPEEVSLQKDRNDYAELRPEQKSIFTSNLKYQTMLDSVQGRGPCLAFLPFCSLPELEGCIVTWDFMETIHSRSYTYIIKNLYSDPSDVFDTIIKDEKIEKRAQSVTQCYDDLINIGHKWHLDKSKIDEYELKKKLWKALVTVNILEGLRFYVSFACSFAFGELKLLEGSAKIISFIARDESQHLAVSQRIINNYRDVENDKVMNKVIKDTEDDVYKMYDEAVQEEKRWVDHWLNSRSTQNAPQETEIESYVIGGIKQDVKKDQFKKFKL